jgi:hypothetical protein
VEVVVLVERDEVRVVGNDEILARAPNLACEAPLHGGFQVHGWFVQHRDPAGAVPQERAQGKRLLYSGARQFHEPLTVLPNDGRLDDHCGLAVL